MGTEPLVSDRSAGGGRRALPEGSESAWISATREFLGKCIAATHLREHASSLNGAGPGWNGVLDACVLEALDRFRHDLARFGLTPDSPAKLFQRLQLAPNLLATFFYRLNHALYRREMGFLPDVLAVVARLLTGTEIYYSSEIGPGLKLIHGVGTVIGAGCRIGSRFTVYQGVTIGDKLGKETGRRPVIENEVIVSAGAKILGPITIGSRTVIGANAVVTRSLPGRCMAGGLPTHLKVANITDEQFEHYVRSIRG